MGARERVGTNVKRLRRERDLSQEELAHLADLHQTYLSAVENGKRNPSIGVLERVAIALKVDISALFVS